MADDEAVAVWDYGAQDRVAVLGGDGGGGEGAEVEEDADARGGHEFGEELDEDGGGHVAGLVEEDAEACGWGELFDGVMSTVKEIAG